MEIRRYIAIRLRGFEIIFVTLVAKQIVEIIRDRRSSRGLIQFTFTEANMYSGSTQRFVYFIDYIVGSSIVDVISALIMIWYEINWSNGPRKPITELIYIFVMHDQ